jgi:hypothetical protein
MTVKLTCPLFFAFALPPFVPLAFQSARALFSETASRCCFGVSLDQDPSMKSESGNSSSE